MTAAGGGVEGLGLYVRSEACGCSGNSKPPLRLRGGWGSYEFTALWPLHPTPAVTPPSLPLTSGEEQDGAGCGVQN